MVLEKLLTSVSGLKTNKNLITCVPSVLLRAITELNMVLDFDFDYDLDCIKNPKSSDKHLNVLKNFAIALRQYVFRTICSFIFKWNN